MLDSRRSPSRAGHVLALAVLAHCCRPSPAQAPEAAPAPVAAAAAEPAPAPTAAPPPTPAEGQSSSLTRDLPASCSGAPETCFPPGAFAHVLCKGKHPDLALVMFSKAMPWQHAYVKAEHVEPVNVYGGPTDEQWMFFGEEVVLLFKHSAAKKQAGVQISGPEDVDVLRADGTCATIRQEMLVSYATGEMKSPHVVWKYLDSAMQEALLADKGVQQAYAVERKICRSESVTHPEEACAKQMAKLTQAVLAAVKNGLALPTPEKRPEWPR
jgi:hypothetical protein